MTQTLANFEDWSPNPPTFEGSTSHSVTLSWSAGPYSLLKEQLVYTIQKREKIPPWITVYRRDGGCRSGVVRSQWSAECWARTNSDGTSAACFCMAVRCGYIKQVQQMLEERPVLLSTINSTTGLTPLATAVKKGNVNMARLLLTLGADVEQCSSGGRTPLQLAVLAGHCTLAELLMDQRADIQARDVNGLRVEHHAVDSRDLEMLRLVLDRGDVTVRDNNGWTPLFRAICQGSRRELIEELLRRGSAVEVTDRAGLTLLTAARLLKDRQTSVKIAGEKQQFPNPYYYSGRRRESVLRLVDTRFQHEKALVNFTRLTSKISSVQALLNK